MKNLFIATILLILLNPLYSEANCKSKRLEGTWYGSFINNYGNEFRIIVEMNEFDKCTFSGTLSWPNYYNSIAKIEGVIDGDSIQFSETESLQGFLASTTPIFKGVIDGSKIAGRSFDDGIRTGDFSLIHYSTLDEGKINEYLTRLEESENKFGITSILEDVDVDTSEIIRKQFYYDSLSNSFNEGVVNEGEIGFNEIYFPLKMTILYPDYFRIDSDFQGSPYISSSTKTQNWNYDPSTDKVYVTEQSDTSVYKISTYFIKSLFKDSMDITSIKNAVVRGIPSYRFIFSNETEKRAVYLDASNYVIIREETDEGVQEYLEPYVFKNAWWIRKMIQYNGSNKTIYRYDTIYLDPSITPEYFEIPEEYKSKIDRSTEFEKEYFSKAQEYVENKEFSQAIEFFSKAININPDNYEYYYRRALAKQKIEDYYGALSDLESALRLNTNNTEIINQKGTIKYALGDYNNSVKDFQEVISIDSTYAVAYFNIGYIYSNNRNFRGAKNYFDYAIRYDSSNASYRFNRGIMLNELNAYDSALSDFDKTISLEYTEVYDVYNRIGVSYYRKENYDSAVLYFSKAKEGSDKDIFDKNLAHALYQNQEYKDAAKIFEGIVKVSEEDHSTMNFLGLCYYRLNDYDGAIFYFDKAITIASNYSSYYQNRAFAKKQLGSYTSAIEDFTQAIRLNPQDSENYYQVGYINEIQHNKFDACIYYKKAIEKGYEATQEMDDLCDLTNSTD